MSHIVYAGIGSNIGDRESYLKQAIALLNEQPQIDEIEASPIYETAPVGGVPQGDFYNQALRIKTSLEPEQLLNLFNRIEKQLGRHRIIHWGPRTIDLDILFFDELEMDAPSLIIPHPEIANRRFVLIPLLDVIQDEQLEQRVKEMLVQTADQQAVRKFKINSMKTFSNEEQLNIETSVQDLLKTIGDDPKRPGLQETPKRVAKAMQEIFAHTGETHFEDYTLFDSDAQNEMVVIRDISFYSMCEHHLLPFFGTVDIAYIPNDKVIGLSKVPRLVEWASRRPSVQEELTTLIADELARIIGVTDVAVVIKARHTCMEMRGINKIGSTTITTKYLGQFKANQELRQEFKQQLN